MQRKGEEDAGEQVLGGMKVFGFWFLVFGFWFLVFGFWFGFSVFDFRS
jgi:hypothetical protein